MSRVLLLACIAVIMSVLTQTRALAIDDTASLESIASPASVLVETVFVNQNQEKTPKLQGMLRQKGIECSERLSLLHPKSTLQEMERFLQAAELQVGFTHRAGLVRKMRNWASHLLGRSIWGAIAAVLGYMLSGWGRKRKNRSLSLFTTSLAMVTLGYAYALLLPAIAALALVAGLLWLVKQLNKAEESGQRIF